MGDNSHPSRDEGIVADMAKNVAPTGGEEEKEKVVNVLVTGFGVCIVYFSSVLPPTTLRISPYCKPI